MSYAYLPFETELANIKALLIATAERNDEAMISYVDGKIALESEKINDALEQMIEGSTVQTVNDMTGAVNISSAGTITVA
jgi:hypothetical protein